MSSKRNGKRRRPQSMDIDFINNPPSPSTGSSSSSLAVRPSPSFPAPVHVSQVPPASERSSAHALLDTRQQPTSDSPASSRRRTDPSLAPTAGSLLHLPPLPPRSVGAIAAPSATRPEGRSDKTKRPYVCEICGFSFSQRSDRAKHQRTVHQKLRPFACSECSATFGTKCAHTLPTNPLRRPSTAGALMIQCVFMMHEIVWIVVSNALQIVSYFSSLCFLGQHRKAVHVKDRPFQCTHCSSTFAFQDGLQRHIHMVHLSERPHICLTCGKAFKQKAHLEKHVSSVHEKRRPSVCPVPGCNAAFRENYNLKQHQRSVHNMDV